MSNAPATATAAHTTPADTTGYSWAVFSAEGMLEGGLSYAAAVEAAATTYDEDDDVVVDRECPDHEEERARACEVCADDDLVEAVEEDEDDPENLDLRIV